MKSVSPASYLGRFTIDVKQASREGGLASFTSKQIIISVKDKRFSRQAIISTQHFLHDFYPKDINVNEEIRRGQANVGYFL